MRRILMLLLALSVQACARTSPLPTQTIPPLPTFTARVTAAPLQTQIAAASSPTSDALATLVPQGTPAKQWESIPIMPGALAGQGDDLGYTFTIDATAEQIGDFYRKELAARGWQYLPYAEGNTGNAMMVFKSGDQTLILSVHEYEGQGLMVILVK